ncbi:hypothetical protein [Streptomyces sp. NPDC088350]|uniref:hypothetical protein n=1 Tax=Streptomyces sp. NPDC088350 TaxID=3365854 RepID=UPI0037F2B007
MTAPVNRRDSHRGAAQPGDRSGTQQYYLDTYRARRLGEAPPPPSGAHEWRTAREPRGYRRFRAVGAGRPARGRLRRALGRWLHPHTRSAC